ncbi:hypothetical protein [Pedobacter sp. N23S346]|uniref:hypothetical protein n=1 Tax=Pedobacter sp. N23S346 TaxID=3402750 RepID=UPI003AD62925
MKKLVIFMLSLSLTWPAIAQTRQETIKKKTEKSKPAKKGTTTGDTIQRDTARRTFPPQSF